MTDFPNPETESAAKADPVACVLQHGIAALCEQLAELTEAIDSMAARFPARGVLRGPL